MAAAIISAANEMSPSKLRWINFIFHLSGEVEENGAILKDLKVSRR
jgi:hypothetical protein